MAPPNQKVLYYNAKVNYGVLNQLHDHIDQFQLQMEHLIHLAPERVTQIGELDDAIHDFKNTAERENARLLTKKEDYARYARVQTLLQENEYALEQMHADAQAHKRRRTRN